MSIHILKLCADLWRIIGKYMDYIACYNLKGTSKKLRRIFYKYIFSGVCITGEIIPNYLNIKRRYINKINVLKVCIACDEDLFFLRRLTNLIVLDLSNTDVSDKGIGYLRAMKIESLNLHGCYKCSLDVITTIASFLSLKHVDLRFSSPVKEERTIKTMSVFFRIILDTLDNVVVNELPTINTKLIFDDIIKNLTVQTINVLNNSTKILVEEVFINAVVTSDHAW